VLQGVLWPIQVCVCRERESIDGFCAALHMCACVWACVGVALVCMRVCMCVCMRMQRVRMPHLATQVPHLELHVLVLQGFYVEADGGHRGDGLVNLQAV
jgi:hypothetical protein